MNNTTSELVVNYIFPYGKYVLSALAILTNIIVVATIISSWKFWKHSTGLLMLTLACIDIMGGIFQIMMVSRKFWIKFEDGRYINVPVYLTVTLSNISNYMMVLISHNRYALVCKPFNHYRITSRKSVLIQIITIIIILPCLNFYLFFRSKLYIGIYFISFFIVYVCLSHVVPMITSVILTVLVSHKISKNTEEIGGSLNTESCRLGERNITKAMIAVIVAFVILTLPHIVANTVLTLVVTNILKNYSSQLRSINAILFVIRDINYSINIFIYSAFIPRFQRTLLNLLTCKSDTLPVQKRTLRYT